MADVQPTTEHAPIAAPADTDAEMRSRLTGEAANVVVADAELNEGLYVDAAEVRAWIGSPRTATPLPPPPTRRR